MLFNLSLSVVAATVLLILSRPVHAQAIGSFYHQGPAVVSHDPVSGNFLYSVDSAKGYSDMMTLNVTMKPKNNTAIACTGYILTPSIWGSIFYQAANNSLAQIIMKCSYASGICVNYGEYVISDNLTTPASPNTKLAAALFNKGVGYRVTYQDIHGALRQITYTNGTGNVVTWWADGVRVSNITVPDGYPIATIYANPTNVSRQRESLYVATDSNILALEARVENKTANYTIHDSKTWVAYPSLNPPPTFLPSHSHLATLSYNNWQMALYIDSTSHLQLIRSTSGGETWTLEPPQDGIAWPLADEPHAPLAAVSSKNLTTDYAAYVFYRSGGRVVQVRVVHEEWERAVVVEKPPEKMVVTPNNIPNPPESKSASSVVEARRVTIGVSTGAAVLLLVVASLVVYLRRRRNIARRMKDNQKEDSIFGYDESGSGSSHGLAFGKPELCGTPANIVELDHDPECLLLHQLQCVRLGEVEGDDRLREELDGRGGMRGELEDARCACICAIELDGGMKAFCELGSGSVRGGSLAQAEVAVGRPDEADEKVDVEVNAVAQKVCEKGLNMVVAEVSSDSEGIASWRGHGRGSEEVEERSAEIHALENTST